MKHTDGQIVGGRGAGFRFWVRVAVLALLCGVISACQGGIDSVFPKAERPIPEHLIKKMKAKGMMPASPIMLRIFKEENLIEVWKERNNGRFDLLESYEICKWSGKLGPKFEEGDRQAPEGFYRVGKAQMNPYSDYHLSFNIGFPNTYDRSHGRTGSHLMVHGACSSAGCYSMTDERVEEIYSLAREALNAGQDYFQVQAFPFRMTPENLAKHVDSQHFDFWKMVKEGYDHFEITRYPPKVDVCEKRYIFNRVEEEGTEFSSRKECPPVTMPGSLIEAYSKLLKTENEAFRKALKRERMRAAIKSEDFPDIAIDTASLVAPGSEILPPPTPEPEPAPDADPAIASAPAASSAPDESPFVFNADGSVGEAGEKTASQQPPAAPGEQNASGNVAVEPPVLASEGMPIPSPRGAQ